MIEHRYWYAAALFGVVDADTLDVELDLGFGLYHRVRLRLAGLDAPEPRGETVMAGRKAKRALEWYLGDRDRTELMVRTAKAGKYGRYLAEVWAYYVEVGPAARGGGWKCVNRWLIEQGWAEERPER